ncbi:MAG: hypothetical protein M4579_003904 [Chaenotheca gracillima]|nr:MAG: hypothetical protein M4579_003904 [Chaenotheca gracillima]
MPEADVLYFGTSKFRFHHRRDVTQSYHDTPYLHLEREIEAYRRLKAAEGGASLPAFPDVLGVVNFSAAAEDELVRDGHLSGFKPSASRLRLGATAQNLPLKGLLMEHIDGSRLDGTLLLADVGLQAELTRAMKRMHECFVAWGDVKWRNALVRSTPLADDQQNRLVLLDFSSASFPIVEIRRVESITTEENDGSRTSFYLDWAQWELRRDAEGQNVENMIAYGKISVSSLERGVKG